VWRCDFKYNNELTLVFMSSNQVGGFFNRLEASRKYLFGSLGVLGEPNNSIIAGVFITRGDDIKLAVDCAPDWESYEYKKLDLTNDSDKKFFEDALAWDLELDGKKWADGKNVSYFELVHVKRFSVADDPTLSPVQVVGHFARCRYVESSCCRVLLLRRLLYFVFSPCDINLECQRSGV
jgi:hypothetical protein